MASIGRVVAMIVQFALAGIFGAIFGAVCGYMLSVALTARLMYNTMIVMSKEYTEALNANSQALMQVLVKLSEQPENVNPTDETLKVEAIKTDMLHDVPLM